jgi:hypothetical protein
MQKRRRVMADRPYESQHRPMLGRDGGLTYVADTPADVEDIPLPLDCDQDFYALHISLRVPCELALRQASTALDTLPPGVLGLIMPYIATQFSGYRVYNEFKEQSLWEWRRGRHWDIDSIEVRIRRIAEDLLLIASTLATEPPTVRFPPVSLPVLESGVVTGVRAAAEKDEIRRWSPGNATTHPVMRPTTYAATWAGRQYTYTDMRWMLMSLVINTHHMPVHFTEAELHHRLEVTIEQMRAAQPVLPAELRVRGAFLAGVVKELESIKDSLSAEIDHYAGLLYLQVCSPTVV